MGGVLAPGLLATSSRHMRLSAACLVGATSDNNLSDRSNSMSIKTEIMSLRLAEEMIFGLRVRSHANRVGFYTIPYIQAHILALALLMPESVNFWCEKESHHVLDHFVHDGHWMAIGWLLDGKNLYLLPVWLNIIPLIPIQRYFSMIWFLAVGWNIESVNLQDEVVNLWIFTVGLTLSGCQPHTSSVWPWSGMPKVRLYDTFLGGLRHLPPRMKNQHGLNEENNHIGKKRIPHVWVLLMWHMWLVWVLTT